MSPGIDLKQIERKAFRANYEDGLLDIFYGLVVAFMAVYMYRPPQGYSALNIIIFLTGYGLINLVYWAGKRYITRPRMGQVKFGPMRKRRGATLALALGIIVLVQLGLLSLTALGWANPTALAQFNAVLLERDWMDAAVALVGSLIVGLSMTLIAYFTDFPRGYYIAILASSAVFLMIWLNRPIWPMLLGGLIVLPGVVLFIRFLRTHPLPPQEALNG